MRLRSYRFCTKGPDGRIDTACELPVHSDEEARQIANNLVLQGDFRNIEVWRGETKLYSLWKI